MKNKDTPQQFEVVLDLWKNVKVSGGNLVGDIDYMFGRKMVLFPEKVDLKTIFLVVPAITTTDTNGTVVEMEVEIIMSIYKYDYPFTPSDIYGLFCHAYIAGYHVIRNEIKRLNILHNGEIYEPTMTIPSYESVKEDIFNELKRAYG